MINILTYSSIHSEKEGGDTNIHGPTKPPAPNSKPSDTDLNAAVQSAAHAPALASSDIPPTANHPDAKL